MGTTPGPAVAVFDTCVSRDSFPLAFEGIPQLIADDSVIKLSGWFSHIWAKAQYLD